MAEPQLVKTRVQAGIWEGELTGPDAAPVIEVTHLGDPVEGVEVSAVAGRAQVWLVRFPLPAGRLTDGLQCFVLSDAGTGVTLGTVTVQVDLPDEANLRAEVELLRAELELLKAAFRRHCVDTGAV
ncbi:hypothetical protein [Celeribacter arenosi]|uniref:Uncharacterized protein n=1 Tax=Celeribacter arenosi TaxID=792649 RepID=A0ABP7JZC4_9RHOB